MPLTKDQLQEIQAAALADDVAIDMEKMSLWTQEEATAFFESGGTVAPAPKKAVDPPSSGDSALLAAKEKGSAQLKANDLSAAAASYREALALCTGPELTEKHAAALHSNLAMVLLKMGDAPASLEAADACVGVKPDWHKAHYRKGEALFALKRHTDAAAAYEAGQKLAPSDSDIGRAKQLATEAAKGGVWFRQLLPGRDIALKPSSQIEQLSFGAAAQMQNYIYLIGDATTRECFVVDACWDPAGIAAYAERHKMRLVGAIASHYHFDHVGGTLPPQMQGMVFGPFGVPKGVEPRLPGLREMQTNHGCQLYAHRAECDRIATQVGVAMADLSPLEQGGTIPLGEGGKLRVYHTPGHSGGSICIAVEPAGGGRPSALCAGDTIFPGSCGRLDLPDSDKSAMFDSLVLLRTLDDDIPVYPGHAYGGASTTIGKEKQQGLLRPFTRDAWLTMHG